MKRDLQGYDRFFCCSNVVKQSVLSLRLHQSGMGWYESF